MSRPPRHRTSIVHRLAGLTLLLASVTAGATPIAAVTAVAPGDDLAQRRAVRGVTLDGPESPQLAALRRFEEEELRPALGPGAVRVTGQPPPAYAALALPDVSVRWDERLVRFLDFYRDDRRGRATFTSWLRAQGRYRELIEDALARHHLPRALLYLVMIESGYDPLDRSLVGAAGLWQFMPAGARIYGLRVDHWVDERNDPEKSTEAAMRYLGDLHARFGSWHLALAAFNAGYGAVLAAVAKYNSNDYWTLCGHEDGLPWETVLYVPKLLAAAIVGENRAAFRYDRVEAERPRRPDVVRVASSITLADAARLAQVAPAEVDALNPELRAGRTPPGAPWGLKLPAGSGGRFLARAPSWTQERDALQSHAVRPGERLESIARARGTTVARLRRTNAIRDLAELRPGLLLLVPASGGMPAHDAPGAAPPANAPPLLVAVADKEQRAAGRKRVFYRVVPGDGLSDIARWLGVGVDELARWNVLDPQARLTSGLVLQAFLDEGSTLLAAPGAADVPGLIDPERGPERGADPGADRTTASPEVRVVTTGSDEFLDEIEARRGRRRLVYTVRPGDTLRRIGLLFGLTEGDLERINRRGRATPLPPGDRVIVYVPRTARERIDAMAQTVTAVETEPGEAGGEKGPVATPAGPVVGPEDPATVETAAAVAPVRERTAPDEAMRERTQRAPAEETPAADAEREPLVPARPQALPRLPERAAPPDGS